MGYGKIYIQVPIIFHHDEVFTDVDCSSLVFLPVGSSLGFSFSRSSTIYAYILYYVIGQFREACFEVHARWILDFDLSNHD